MFWRWLRWKWHKLRFDHRTYWPIRDKATGDVAYWKCVDCGKHIH